MPIYAIWLSVFAAAVAFIASLWVEIPRVARAVGYTSSQSHMAKIIPPLPGVLLSLNVGAQSAVKRGEVLGELTVERYSQRRSVDEAQAALALQKTSLARDEIRAVNAGELAQRGLTKMRLSSGLTEMARVKQDLQLAQLRLDDLARQIERQKELQSQGFVSAEAVEVRRSDWLLQKQTLGALERVKLQIQREIATQTEELRLAELRTKAQKLQLLRGIVASEQEYNEHMSKRIQLIAPIDGVVTQISATVGQTLQSGIPIMAIIPPNIKPEVLLLVPSRSIGFVREGQRVSVRYQAYPHEHYGRHYGTVLEVARAALPPQEVVQHVQVSEPVYSVRVSLPNNYLEYQGKQLQLTQGMVVEADVELDRLKIYQWLLEPLYRLGGRI